MKKRKRLLAAALAVVIGISSIPNNIFADEIETEALTELQTEAETLDGGVEEPENAIEPETAVEAETEEISYIQTEPEYSESENDETEKYLERAETDQTESEANTEAEPDTETIKVPASVSISAKQDENRWDIHINAVGANDGDTDVCLYFWDYDKELPDDKNDWSAVLTDPCDWIEIEGLSSDGVITFTDTDITAQYITDQTSACLEFTIPKDSLVDTSFTIDINEDSHDEKTSVIEVVADEDIMDAVVCAWKAVYSETESENESETDDWDATVAVEFPENEIMLASTDDPTATAFAVYCADDYSLCFYRDTTVPSAGDTYNDKTVTAVYTGFETSSYSTSSSVPWYSYRTNIKTVSFVNTISPTSLSCWFYGMTSCTSMDLEKLDTSNVTSMYCMFYNCNSLTSVDVSNFDTSKVTNMQSVFSACSKLTKVDVSGFETSKATTMQYMFYGCSKLTSIDVTGFITANVQNMYGMFYNCYGLTSLDLSNFDTSKVTTMYQMFYNCYGLTSLNLSSFDTGNVTTMYRMFYNCYGLTSLNVSSFNTSKVTTMYQMFYNCNKITELDLSGFNTEKVTSMTNMFYNMYSLEKVTLGVGFAYVGTNGYLPTPSSSYISNADGKWHNLLEESFDASSIPANTADTYYAYAISMFAVYSEDDHSLAFYYDICPKEGEIYNSRTITKIFTEFRFSTYSSYEDVPWKDYSSYITSVEFVDTITPVSTAYWFYGMFGCNTVDLGNLDTSNTLNMDSMFYDCASLQAIDLFGWDTSNVASMSDMFYGCSHITELDLSTFDTSSVLSMADAFTGMSRLLKVTLGDSFTFVDGYLPNPDAAYILNADGYWHNTSGKAVLASEIPSNTAGVYYAYCPYIDFTDYLTKVTVANASGDDLTRGIEFDVMPNTYDALIELGFIIPTSVLYDENTFVGKVTYIAPKEIGLSENNLYTLEDGNQGITGSVYDSAENTIGTYVFEQNTDGNWLITIEFNESMGYGTEITGSFYFWSELDLSEFDDNGGKIDIDFGNEIKAVIPVSVYQNISIEKVQNETVYQTADPFTAITGYTVTITTNGTNDGSILFTDNIPVSDIYANYGDGFTASSFNQSDLIISYEDTASITWLDKTGQTKGTADYTIDTQNPSFAINIKEDLFENEEGYIIEDGDVFTISYQVKSIFINDTIIAIKYTNEANAACKDMDEVLESSVVTQVDKQKFLTKSYEYDETKNITTWTVTLNPCHENLKEKLGISTNGSVYLFDGIFYYETGDTLVSVYDNWTGTDSQYGYMKSLRVTISDEENNVIYDETNTSSIKNFEIYMAHAGATILYTGSKYQFGMPMFSSLFDSDYCSITLTYEFDMSFSYLENIQDLYDSGCELVNYAWIKTSTGEILYDTYEYFPEVPEMDVNFMTKEGVFNAASNIISWSVEINAQHKNMANKLGMEAGSSVSLSDYLGYVDGDDWTSIYKAWSGSGSPYGYITQVTVSLQDSDGNSIDSFTTDSFEYTDGVLSSSGIKITYDGSSYTLSLLGKTLSWAEDTYSVNIAYDMDYSLLNLDGITALVEKGYDIYNHVEITDSNGDVIYSVEKELPYVNLVTKTGKYNADRNTITYSIIVNANHNNLAEALGISNGGNVFLHDFIAYMDNGTVIPVYQNWNGSDYPFGYIVDGITYTLYDSDGNPVDSYVSTGQYGDASLSQGIGLIISYDGSTYNTNYAAYLTWENDNYSIGIEYELDVSYFDLNEVTSLVDSGYELFNYVEVSTSSNAVSGNLLCSTQADIPDLEFLEKTGVYNAETNTLSWTVTINKNHENLAEKLGLSSSGKVTFKDYVAYVEDGIVKSVYDNWNSTESPYGYVKSITFSLYDSNDNLVRQNEIKNKQAEIILTSLSLSYNPSNNSKYYLGYYMSWSDDSYSIEITYDFDLDFLALDEIDNYNHNLVNCVQIESNGTVLYEKQEEIIDSTFLTKTGEYDVEINMYSWTVMVNENHENLAEKLGISNGGIVFLHDYTSFIKDNSVISVYNYGSWTSNPYQYVSNIIFTLYDSEGNAVDSYTRSGTGIDSYLTSIPGTIIQYTGNTYYLTNTSSLSWTDDTYSLGITYEMDAAFFQRNEILSIIDEGYRLYNCVEISTAATVSTDSALYYELVPIPETKFITTDVLSKTGTSVEEDNAILWDITLNEYHDNLAHALNLQSSGESVVLTDYLAYLSNDNVTIENLYSNVSSDPFGYVDCVYFMFYDSEGNLIEKGSYEHDSNDFLLTSVGISISYSGTEYTLKFGDYSYSWTDGTYSIEIEYELDNAVFSEDSIINLSDSGYNIFNYAELTSGSAVIANVQADLPADIISVDKTGKQSTVTYNDDGTANISIQYTIDISAPYGVSNGIVISDAGEGVIDAGSMRIINYKPRNDSNLGKNRIIKEYDSSLLYYVRNSDNSDYGEYSFYGVLPEIWPGTHYLILYTVTLENVPVSTTYSVDNTINCFVINSRYPAESDTCTVSNYIEQFALKTWEYDDQSDDIEWKIVINQEHQNWLDYIGSEYFKSKNSSTYPYMYFDIYLKDILTGYNSNGEMVSSEEYTTFDIKCIDKNGDIIASYTDQELTETDSLAEIVVDCLSGDGNSNANFDNYNYSYTYYILGSPLPDIEEDTFSIEITYSSETDWNNIEKYENNANLFAKEGCNFTGYNEYDFCETSSTITKYNTSTVNVEKTGNASEDGKSAFYSVKFDINGLDGLELEYALEDVLDYKEYTDMVSKVSLADIHLYYYDQSAEDGRGTEIENISYTFDDGTGTGKAVISLDGTIMEPSSFLLKYTYQFTFTDQAYNWSVNPVNTVSVTASGKTATASSDSACIYGANILKKTVAEEYNPDTNQVSFRLLINEPELEIAGNNTFSIEDVFDYNMQQDIIQSVLMAEDAGSSPMIYLYEYDENSPDGHGREVDMAGLSWNLLNQDGKAVLTINGLEDAKAYVLEYTYQLLLRTIDEVDITISNSASISVSGSNFAKTETMTKVQEESGTSKTCDAFDQESGTLEYTVTLNIQGDMIAGDCGTYSAEDILDYSLYTSYISGINLEDIHFYYKDGSEAEDIEYSFSDEENVAKISISNIPDGMALIINYAYKFDFKILNDVYAKALVNTFSIATNTGITGSCSHMYEPELDEIWSETASEKKAMIYNESIDTLWFSLMINGNGDTVNDGNNLTVKDRLDYSAYADKITGISIHADLYEITSYGKKLVTDESDTSWWSGSYNSKSTVMDLTFTLPDGAAYYILYGYTFDYSGYFMADESTGSLSNTAKVVSSVSGETIWSQSVSSYIYRYGSGATAMTSNTELKLAKADRETVGTADETLLENATYLLERYIYQAGSASATDVNDDSAWVEIGTFTTESDGMVEIGSLTSAGERYMLYNTLYRVSEVSSPEGYVVDPETYYIYLENDGTYTYYPANYDMSGNTSSLVNLLSVEEGIATVSDEPVDPVSYAFGGSKSFTKGTLVGDDFTFVSTNISWPGKEDESEEYRFDQATATNEPDGSFFFDEYDFATAGTWVFLVTEQSGNSSVYDGVLYDGTEYTVTVTTEHVNGTDTTYTITSIVVNNGSENVYEFSSADGGVPASDISLDFTNILALGEMELTKTDADNGKKLKDVEFSLKAGDETLNFSYDDSTGVYALAEDGTQTGLVTDQDGRIHVEGLPYGEYTLVEIRAAAGYLLNDTEYTFTISQDDFEAGTWETVPVEISVTNEKVETLPQAGAQGIVWSSLLGILMMAWVVWLLQKERN